jgi:CheY-like chemotaxis protein
MDVEQARAKVLVIDDDPIVLDNVADGLDLLGGYTTVVARDGASGLERFIAERPDCVVVDVRMPGLNGYQFVRSLRGDPATAQTPLVILSALAQDREQLAGVLSGADVYLIKPVKIADLVQAIEDAVKLTAGERQKDIGELLDELP